MNNKPQVGRLERINQIGRRDAFHIPCIVVTSEQSIEPGAYVRFVGDNQVVPCMQEQSQGVADPFLQDSVLRDNPFWVLLNPRNIEDLTHHFLIKGLDDEKPDAGLGLGERNPTLEEFVAEAKKDAFVIAPMPVEYGDDDYYDCCPEDEEECC